MIISVLIPSIEPMFLQFLRHGREGDTLRQIRERIDETSLLSVVMIEGAAFAELAITGLAPVFARDCFVVGVHGPKGGFAEILGKRL